MRGFSEPDRRRRRAWLIALGAVGVALLAGIVVLRQFTNPAFLEKTISSAMGPSYRVDIESSSFNPFARRFVASHISILPDTLSPTVRDGTMRTRYSLTASRLRVSGVNMWALYRGHVAVASVQVDTPRVEIYLDRTIPAAPDQDPSTLPHVLLKEFDRPLRIDTIRIAGGDLRYMERAVDGSRPGIFQFADLNAMITNVTNDTTRMEPPCAIEIRTRLADSGRLNLTAAYDLRPTGLNMNYQGTVGPMGALSLNELLVDLEGIRITSGTIDTTSFAFEVKDDAATGKVRVLFNNVSFEMFDKNSLEKGFGDRFGTMMAKAKARESNPEDDDDPPIEVAIQRSREPSLSLVKFVWNSVREGLLRTLGVQ